MIKLDACEYCDRCPHFEPEVIERPKADILTIYSFCDIKERRKVVTYGDTIMKCHNRDRCAAIYEYMEGQKNAEN